MKNIISSTVIQLVFLLLPAAVFAQAPGQFRFQAVGRDADGKLLANTPLLVRFAIRTGAENGPVAYREQHNVITDEYGHFNANVGGGAVLTGSFDQVPWSSASHFLQIEYNDGSGFKDLGANSLLSVPYALYANQSGVASSASFNIRLNAALAGKGTADDPLDIARQGASAGQVLKWNGLSWTPADDSNSDNQILVLNGNTLTISGGNSINLPAQVTYQAGAGIELTNNIIQNTGDLSPSNELQQLTKNGNVISLSSGGGSVTDEVNDADADPANEIQLINRVGSIISLNKGGGQVDLSDLGSKWLISGQNIFRVPGNIGVGTNLPEQKLHVLGSLLVEDNQLGAFRIGQSNNGNQYWLGTTGNADMFEIGYKPNGGSTMGRISIAQNGNVGIGNTSPNARLAIGRNINQQRNYPVVTVGDTLGGAIQIGNDTSSLSVESGLAVPLSQITSDGPLGKGKGDISIQARGVHIGPGHDLSPFKLKVAHETFGFALENANTEKNWEWYVNETLNGLDLFYDGTYKGTFDAVTGGYFNTSDTLLKSEMMVMESVSDKIKLLQVYRYQFKDNETESGQIGVSAQQVNQLFPELSRKQSSRDGSEILTVNYAALSAIAIKALQEQDLKLAELEQRIDAQDQLIQKIMQELEALKKN